MLKPFNLMPLPFPGVDSDEDGEAEFGVDGEQLEDDEELRLHIHGCNHYFTK